jgi:branched-chain amino acid transport system substrate-binding protein
MKRNLLIVIACITLSLLLGSCSKKPTTKAPYKVAFNLDMTGALSYMGPDLKLGAEWALAKINAEGGINGRLIEANFYDGKSDAAEAVKNTRKMIDVDKAAICLGYDAVEESLACVDTCKNTPIVLFSCNPCIVLGEPVEPWHFTCAGDQSVGSIPLLIDNLIARGSKKIAYVYLNIVYGQTGGKIFKAQMEKRGLTPVAIENYDFGATDFTPQATHIKTSGADGLLITGLSEDTVNMIKAMRGLGLNYPIVSDYAIPSPQFIELGGKYAEGIVTSGPRTLVAHDLPDSDGSKALCVEVYDYFTEKYGNMSAFYTHLIDQVNIFAIALKKIDAKLDPSKDADLAKIRVQLRDNIEGISGYTGNHGLFNYSPTNHSGLDVGCYPLLVVKDGKWRLYDAVKK